MAVKTKKWTVTQYPQDSGKVKVIAVSPDRVRVMHVDGLSAEEAKKFDGEAEWQKQSFKGIKGRASW